MRFKRIRSPFSALSGFLAVLALFLLFPSSSWAAQAVECLLVAEDVGSGYRYEAPGIGGFSVNGREGETLSAAVISLDEGCRAELFRDGYEADFSNGVILDNGSYELRLYREDGSDEVYGVFNFTVENSYGDMLDYSEGELTQIANPQMELDYSSQTGMFTYTLPDGEYISADVPLGGWSSSRVQMEASDQLTVYRVLKDGEPMDFSAGLMFNLPGSYRITLWDNEFGLQGDTGYRVDYCFVLFKQDPCNVSHINAPMGFEIKDLTRDGISQEILSPDFVQLEMDGKYEIYFENPEGTISWKTSIQRDATPPALTFSPDIKDGTVSDYVNFTSSQPDADIRILWNGQQVEAYSPRLAMDGRYRITVTDTAGNSRQYEFTLRKGYSIRGGYLVIIPVLLLAAAGGIVFYWRRNMIFR